jgi:hypothetical protein
VKNNRAGRKPLVPRLRLGTHVGKLCFLSGEAVERDCRRQAELADLRAQAEPGHEGAQGDMELLSAA